MSTISDIKKCLNFIRKNVILMHCVSSYPAPDKSLNHNSLHLIKKLGFK